LNNELQEILDICWKRIASGESIEKCLADYPRYRRDLEALLKTATAVNAIPRVSPTAEFRRISQNRLVDSLRREANLKTKQPVRKSGWQGLFNNPYFRPLVPAALVLILIFTVTLSYITRPGSKIEAAAVSISILSGQAEIQTDSASNWQPASDGLFLNAGSQVKTLADSYAVLTFVDGSTTKLEPETELAISTSQLENQITTSIELQQKVGKTWSYVQPANNDTKFSIQTPSSMIVAHGTAFITDVGSSGTTTVAAVEGTVNVSAQEEKVDLTQQQTEVQPNSAPQPPEPLIKAADRITVSIGVKAIGSITDPFGSSTGYLPSGISFNQITGSTNNLFSNGQQIEVFQPVGGIYSVVVHTLAQEIVPVEIQFKTSGQSPISYNSTLDPAIASIWSMRLDLSNGPPASQEIAMEPEDDQQIEHVIETALALARAKPFGQPVIAKPTTTSTTTATTVTLPPTSETVTGTLPPTSVTVATNTAPVSTKPDIPTVKIEAPESVVSGSDFTASINVSQLKLLDAGNYDIVFDPSVLKLVGVISGNIGGTEMPVVGMAEIKPGVFRILQNLTGLSGVSGAGTLAVLQFHVIGGETSKIEFAHGLLVDNQEIIIDVNWIGAIVEVKNEANK
jgi:hypothetical protein